MLDLLLPLVLSQTSNATVAARALELWNDSPQVVALRSSIAASRKQASVALTDAPFAAGLSTSATQYQRRRSDDVASVGRPFFTWDSRAELSYRSRAGLGVSLSGAIPWVVNEPDLYPDPQQLPFSAALEVSYDLLRGGGSGLAWTRAQAQAAQLEAAQLQLDQQLLDHRLSLVRGLARLAAVSCKLSVLEGARTEVEKAIAEARVRLQTKVLSYKDFLNFQDLENNFKRQLVALEAEQAVVVTSLEQFGPALGALAASAAHDRVSCDTPFAELLARAEGALPAERVGPVARALPGVRASQAQAAAAALRERAAGLSQLPVLSPFLAAEVSRVHPNADALVSGGGGVRGTFEVVVHRAAQEREAARLEQTAAARTLEAQALLNGSLLRTLRAEISSLRRSEEVQQQSLKTSGELLKTLEAQRAIGQVDSLTFASAWLNLTQTRLQLLDSWASVDRAGRELSTYAAWVAPAGAPP